MAGTAPRLCGFTRIVRHLMGLYAPASFNMHACALDNALYHYDIASTLLCFSNARSCGSVESGSRSKAVGSA